MGPRSSSERPLYGLVLHFRDGGDAYEDDAWLWVAPGGFCVADAIVRHPSYLRPVVRVGSTFDVHEGQRITARGVVQEIFGPGPEQDLG